MELRFLLFIYNKDFGIDTITNSGGLKGFFFFFLPFLYPHIRISAPIQFHTILLCLTHLLLIILICSLSHTP